MTEPRSADRTGTAPGAGPATQRPTQWVEPGRPSDPAASSARLTCPADPPGIPLQWLPIVMIPGHPGSRVSLQRLSSASRRAVGPLSIMSPVTTRPLPEANVNSIRRDRGTPGRLAARTVPRASRPGCKGHSADGETRLRACQVDDRGMFAPQSRTCLAVSPPGHGQGAGTTTAAASVNPTMIGLP